MIKRIIVAASALALTTPVFAQEEPAAAPSPNEIVAAAHASDWVAIPADDLLVMDLAPDAEDNPRRVVIQLMPAPFSQGWVENIKLLAKSHWYDNISVNRVQDNYVVQWGDPNYDNPEAEGETKRLPEGLKVMREDEYAVEPFSAGLSMRLDTIVGEVIDVCDVTDASHVKCSTSTHFHQDPRAYSLQEFFEIGWPLAGDTERIWPVHCYGMVGVGRNLSPDTGSGAELYTVIGHAPRHLDRNIALVGRVIEGMEHLSSLPRGKGQLGFYGEDELGKRTPILTVRLASELHEIPPPTFEYLSTESESFARYAEARANRRDPFFIHPAGGADICNVPVPVRRVPTE